MMRSLSQLAREGKTAHESWRDTEEVTRVRSVRRKMLKWDHQWEA